MLTAADFHQLFPGDRQPRNTTGRFHRVRRWGARSAYRKLELSHSRSRLAICQELGREAGDLRRGKRCGLSASKQAASVPYRHLNVYSGSKEIRRKDLLGGIDEHAAALPDRSA